MGHVGFDPSSVTPITGNLAVAWRMARAGLSVFPCDWRPKPDNQNSPTKRPLVKWASEATDDLEQILRWWARWPDALVGLPVGVHGLIVVDADRHGGPDGVAAFQSYISKHAMPDGVPIVETLSGGRHYYFAQPAGKALGNSKGALPAGIDVRGAGGFVIAPGTVWRDASYRDAGPQTVADAFEAGTVQVAPAWLVKLLEPAPEPPRSLPPRSPSPSSDRREEAYARAALDAECAEVASTGEGGRNTALNKAAFSAGTMIGAGWIGRGECESALIAAAAACGLKGWEARATIRSGLNGGEKKPREPLGEDELATFYDPQPRRVIIENGVAADAETGEIIAPAIDPPWRKKEIAAPVGEWAPSVMARGGLVADIARWIMDCAWRPQLGLSIASAIAIVGTVASRQLKSPTGANLNTYVVMIGPTSSGKDAPLSAAGELLRGAGLDIMLGSEFSSEVGIYDRMHDHPVTLAPMNEFGSTLAASLSRNASPHMAKIVSALRKFYDGGVMCSPHSVSRSSEILVNPCLSILAATTPEQFFNAISGAQAEDGTLNRFLAIQTEKVAKSRPSRALDEPPKSLCDRLRAIADRLATPDQKDWARPYQRMVDGGAAPTGAAIPWTPDADARWNAYDDALIERMERDHSVSLFGPRCAQNAIRVAAILAIAENSVAPMVGADHVEIGIAIAESSLAAMTHGYETHSASTPESIRAERILSALRRAGGTLTHRKLLNNRKRDFRSAKEFDAAISMLIQTGDIELGEIKHDKGPSGRIYILKDS
jgi:hypothetical protein